MPDLLGLTERQITYLACALNATLFAARRDEGAAGEELRQHPWGLHNRCVRSVCNGYTLAEGKSCA